MTTKIGIVGGLRPPTSSTHDSDKCRIVLVYERVIRGHILLKLE